MSLPISAFDFHAGLEGPWEFVRRQKLAIMLCGGVFATIMLAASLSVDPAYYYPRIITDQLLYYLKAQSFVLHGTTLARAAVNLAPFDYASGPGLLRAPLMFAFSDFDDQLRAIQITNVAMALVLGVISAYIVSWVLPLKLHAAAVAYSFATLLFNPVWVTNVLSPLADLPYAVASLAALIVLTRLICGPERERSSSMMKALFLSLFAAAFVFRYTAPVLLVYGWALYRERPAKVGRQTLSRRMAISMFLTLGLLIAANWKAIVLGYLWQPFLFLAKADRFGMVLNVVANGLPTQVVPGFDLLYRYHPITRQAHPAFATNPFDVWIVLIALGISTVAVSGMWIERRRLRPELLYVLAPMIVLMSMLPSTARYLLSYQPIIWMFVYAGLSAAVSRAGRRFDWRPAHARATALVACVAVIGLLYVRSARLTGDSKVTLANFSLGATRRHAPDVARTYRALRGFLEGLPRDRALIIGDRAATGQWMAIAQRDHYMPDKNLPAAALSRDLYLVVACPTRVMCNDFEGATTRAQARVLEYGIFRFDKVFETRNDYASARVYRLTAAQ